MSKYLPNKACALAPLLVATLSYSAPSLADRYKTTQGDFGGVGLMQTPTARMAPVGSFSFNANRTSPYSRYSISVQPLPWMEGTLRYIAITNRRYSSVEEFSGDQSYKDKAVDAKFRLLREGYWHPEIALGFRDLAGTGLFSSEFVVANKRFYDLDFSLGVAWGYIGNRGDFTNPFSILGSNYDERSGKTAGTGGDFSLDNYFRGRPSIFGGLEYQTPWEDWRVKVELEGNDYKSEPLENNQHQDLPVNVGFVYSLNDYVDFTAGWQRGDTAMFGITLRTNLKTEPFPDKLMDPAPEARRPLPVGVSATSIDWTNVSQRLRVNAGIEVEKIESRGRELIVTGEQQTFRNEAQGLGRASRILDNSVGEDSYDWYTLVSKQRGLRVAEISIAPDRLRDLEQNRIDWDDMRRSTVVATPSILHEEAIHEQPLDQFDYGLSLGYLQNIGGPDGFILYQFLARFDAEYRFSRNQWLQGTVSANLINNFDKFTVTGPSELPRVRTYIREYLTSSDVIIENLQFTQTKQFGRDVYAMGYIGLLESMFGGAGGEVLYRPVGSGWALGADLNWVKQRGFKQDFSFRDYSTVTGHVTAYAQTGFHDILVKGSVGRYLAEDIGATLDLSRRFDNGIVMGAWATRTNVSAEEFGEGSFDKGIYFTFPFDAFFAKSTRSEGAISWSPLTRDGGARLIRYNRLYDMTQGASINRFNEGFHSLLD